MNIRSFMVLGAVMTLGLSACIFESTTGGSSSNTSAGDGGADPSGGVGGGSSSSGGAQCDEDLKCGVAITPPDGDPSLLCDGTDAAMLYDAFQACTCTGACATDCGNADRCTAGAAADDLCEKCILDTNTGCGKASQACANDI